MNAKTFNLNETELRAGMSAFWNDALSVKPYGGGLCWTMPVMLPDGVQVVLRAREVTPGKVVLSDGGETLQWLAMRGLQAENGGFVEELLRERCAFFGFEINGAALEKVLSLPLPPEEVQIFAEGLASVAHLIYRQERIFQDESVAVAQIQGALYANKVKFVRRKEIPVSPKRKISVDFYFEAAERERVIKAFDQKSRQLDVVDLWARRWALLKNAHERMDMAMVYDEHVFQPVDEVRELAAELAAPCVPAHRVEDLGDFLCAA